MFEDSLVESQHRIRTRSRRWMVVSFFAQTAILALLILLPLLQPQALPKQSLQRLLVAPPPPAASVQVRAAATSHSAPEFQSSFAAPSRIPTHIAMFKDSGPPVISNPGDIGGPTTGIPGGILFSAAAAPSVVLKPATPKAPVPVSSGVAAGQLLSPIQPRYPEIAKAALISGTVIIEATISRQGKIENLHVIEGPPMLRQAAVTAVSAARYRPFLLNGEPVEVQTTIRVIFSLGG